MVTDIKRWFVHHETVEVAKNAQNDEYAKRIHWKQEQGRIQYKLYDNEGGILAIMKSTKGNEPSAK